MATTPATVTEALALARDPGALRDRLCEIEPRAAAEPDAIRIVRAPGRVNLIGEHTDYNSGLVLPVAIDLGITIALLPTTDRQVRLHLAASGEVAVIDLDGDPAPGPGPGPAGGRPRWSDYVAGMARALEDEGGRIGGFVGVLAADLPAGVGLSSSAALDVAAGWALAGGRPPLADPMAVARAAQRAETDFVGVPVGLMDPFAVVFGTPHSAVLLDCRSLAHRAVTLPAATALVVTDSGVARNLRTSGYAQRRADCERAVAILARRDRRITTLRDVSLEHLEAAFRDMGDVAYRRARHVVTENERVRTTVAALDADDPSAAGRALLASHASLRDDFEASLPVIDRLVEIAAAVPGVFGSRLTGGGFGGATISLVRDDAVDRLTSTLLDRYRSPAGDPPTVRRVRASAGAGLVEIPA